MWKEVLALVQLGVRWGWQDLCGGGLGQSWLCSSCRLQFEFYSPCVLSWLSNLHHKMQPWKPTRILENGLDREFPRDVQLSCMFEHCVFPTLCVYSWMVGSQILTCCWQVPIQAQEGHVVSATSRVLPQNRLVGFNCMLCLHAICLEDALSLRMGVAGAPRKIKNRANPKDIWNKMRSDTSIFFWVHYIFWGA